MATLMEKDALLTEPVSASRFYQISLIIAQFRASGFRRCSQAISQLSRLSLFTPAELVDFTQGKILLQQVRINISMNSTILRIQKIKHLLIYLAASDKS